MPGCQFCREHCKLLVELNACLQCIEVAQGPLRSVARMWNTDYGQVTSFVTLEFHRIDLEKEFTICLNDGAY